MRVLKTDLAQWLVNENDDCGHDTYFSDDRRCAISTEESHKKFMKEFTKDDLIELINNYSEEGQEFLEKNNLI